MSVTMRNGRVQIRRVDSTQKDIKLQLESAGIQVWIIGEPCDLLVRFYCTRHRDYCWQPIEVKTPYGKKEPKARVDSRQTTQTEFLRLTNTPVVTSFDEAWAALNARHKLVNIQYSYIFKPSLTPQVPP